MQRCPSRGSADAKWLYGDIGQAWARWLPESASATLSPFDYYSAPVPRHNLRIFALSTNLHCEGNFWLWAGETDFASMLDWLEKALLDAENAGEMVYIVGHHPALSTTTYFGERLYELSVRFNHTIAAMFYGHTHRDSIGVATNFETGEPMFPMLVPGAVNPFQGNNPSFRVMKVHPETYDVLDYDQYRVDLSEQRLLNNVDISATPSWNLAYSARQEYGLHSLRAEDISLMLKVAIAGDLSLVSRLKSNLVSGNR